MEKSIKLFYRFLQTTAVIFTGSVVSSLWITNSDTWKISLPIVLICITLERYLKREYNISIIICIYVISVISLFRN